MTDADYLTISAISKHYAGGGGINHVDLALPRGEMLVLLGPSGCGKTTLLRVIAGLLTPDAGTIRLGGRDITAVPTHKRNISMVFQTWALFPTMSVRDNVGFGLRMKRIPRDRRRQRVDAALALVGLSDFADRKPRQLSGGQQQRVALARAIVVEPDVLLLDEPLSSLDHRIRVQLRGQLKRLQRELGLTSVYVTHDHTEALALGDQIAIIDGGDVIETGAPIDVFNRPRRRHTAEFLALANVIPTVVDGGKLLTTFGDSVECVLPPGEPEPISAVALRPDAIRMVASSSGDQNAHAAIVRAVEYQPGGILHEVQLLANGMIVQVIAAPGEGFAVDSKVGLTFELQKAVPLVG